MICPRDKNALQSAVERGMTVDRCHTCRGAWYDYGELAQLEATVAEEDQRTGMIEYAKHESVLACPSCGKTMRAFNYRAYNLELDACGEGHGFWLDADESERVRAIMQERVEGLARASSAQEGWELAKVGGPSVVDKIKGFFTGHH